MQILFFLGTLKTGGAERQIAQLVQGLAQRGHDISVVTVYSGGQYWDWLQNRRGIQIQALFETKLKSVILVGLQLALSVVKLRHLLRKNRFKLVYSTLYMSNFIAWLAVQGIPEVNLVWGIRASSLKLNWKRSLPFYLCKLVSVSVPLLIANSQAGLAYHEAKGYHCKRHRVIPNGINISQFYPNSEAGIKVRKEWRVSEEETLIGIVGRLDPIKDHPTFLKAAAILAKQRKDVRFVCVGDGSMDYRQELYILVNKLGLDKHLIWTGERKDMPAVYNALDIVCSSSLSEGFPNVIAEAMACGVTCVVTDVGDSASIVGQAGLVIQPGNPEALVDAWLQLIVKKLLDKETCRERIVKEFSLLTLVNKTETILKSFQ